jgi:hypothetical protein
MLAQKCRHPVWPQQWLAVTLTNPNGTGGLWDVQSVFAGSGSCMQAACLVHIRLQGLTGDCQELSA